MIVNDTVSGIVAVVLGYLVGGFPSAYIVTRLVKGKDIRQIGTGHTGTGNMGARNVFVNVGKLPGAIVAIFDIAKGTGTIYLAQFVLGRPDMTPTQLHTAVLFLLGAGLAAVVGHIFPVYIGFKGGAGLATAIGVLVVLLPRETLAALSAALILIVVTKNVLLSVNVSLLSTPLWAWFFFRPWWLAVYPLVIAVVMFGHFLPNVMAEVRKAGSFDKLMGSLIHREPRGK